MDKRKMSIAGGVLVICVVTAVTASSLTVHTPLYTIRMEKASNDMGFLPTAVNEFTYTTESGYTVDYNTQYCGNAHPLAPTWPSDPSCDPSCLLSCVTCETCISTCSTCTTCSTCNPTCNEPTCLDTCPDTCELTCPATCYTCPGNNTCWSTCPNTCSGDTCDGGYTCKDTCGTRCP